MAKKLFNTTSIKNKIMTIPKQIKASFWFLICSFLQKGISVITTPIFTRLLTTEEYGKFNVFNSWMGIIAVIITLNMYAGVYIQGLVKFNDEAKEYSSSLQGLTFVLLLFWTGIYASFHNFWNNLFGLTTVQMFAMLIMIWMTAIFGFWAAEQRVKLNYWALVIVTLIVSVLKPTVGILFVKYSADKVTARILGLMLVEIVGYFALFFIQMVKGKKFFSKKFWIYALSFAIPLIPHYLSQTILSSSDRIMIKNMVGESEAGIYSLAYSVSQIMMLFSTALLSTMTPWFYQKIKDKNVSDISKVSYPSLIGIAFVNLVLIIMAPEIVKIFAPAEYYDAIWVIPPVALSVIFSFSYNLYACFEFYYKKSWMIALASVIGAALNIVLNYIFIPILGYYAAGYTTLSCYIVYALMHFIFMRIICKDYLNNVKVYDWKILLIIYSIAIGIGIGFMLLYNYPIVRYCVVGILALLVIIFWKKIMFFAKKILSNRKSIHVATKGNEKNECGKDKNDN